MAKMYVKRHEDDRPENDRVLDLFRSIENAHFTAVQQEVLANILRHVTGYTLTEVEPKEEMHEYSTRGEIAPPYTTGATGRARDFATMRETHDLRTPVRGEVDNPHYTPELDADYYTNEPTKPREKLDPTFHTTEDINTNDNDAI